MTSTQIEASPTCPDPLQRAARADAGDEAHCEWMRLGPPALHGALIALVGRDTRKLALRSAQRLTHFPASTMLSISWFHGAEPGMVERGDNGPCWRPFGASVVVSGSQSRHGTSWAPDTGLGHIACFEADAAQALFELDLAALQDRVVPAEQVIGPRWRPLWDALLACEDVDPMAVLESHLAGRWQALQGRSSSQPSLRQVGRDWVQRLAWRAEQWRRVHSPRHVERRIKAFSGRSLREWQTLVKTEGLFFAARDRFEAGQPFDWVTLAQEEGFADQAHMIRQTKRITGFSPTEFAERFTEDESFWLYRLWV